MTTSYEVSHTMLHAGFHTQPSASEQLSSFARQLLTDVRTRCSLRRVQARQARRVVYLVGDKREAKDSQATVGGHHHLGSCAHACRPHNHELSCDPRGKALSCNSLAAQFKVIIFLNISFFLDSTKICPFFPSEKAGWLYYLVVANQKNENQGIAELLANVLAKKLFFFKIK